MKTKKVSLFFSEKSKQHGETGSNNIEFVKSLYSTWSEKNNNWDEVTKVFGPEYSNEAKQRDYKIPKSDKHYLAALGIFIMSFVDLRNLCINHDSHGSLRDYMGKQKPGAPNILKKIFNLERTTGSFYSVTTHSSTWDFVLNETFAKEVKIEVILDRDLIDDNQELIRIARDLSEINIKPKIEVLIGSDKRSPINILSYNAWDFMKKGFGIQIKVKDLIGMYPCLTYIDFGNFGASFDMNDTPPKVEVIHPGKVSCEPEKENPSTVYFPNIERLMALNKASWQSLVLVLSKEILAPNELINIENTINGSCQGFPMLPNADRNNHGFIIEQEKFGAGYFRSFDALKLIKTQGSQEYTISDFKSDLQSRINNALSDFGHDYLSITFYNRFLE